MLRLHPDWRRILLWSWSIRCMVASALMGGVAAGLTVAQPYLHWNPILVACAVGISTTGSALAAIWTRLLDQGGFHGPQS